METDGLYRLLGEWTDIFAFVGLSVIAILIVVFIANIIEAIKTSCYYAIKKYKDRHQLKKPPTAKCYCVACDYWLAADSDRTYGRCTNYVAATHGYNMNATEFCSRGVPRTTDNYKYEEFRLRKD